MVQLQILFPPVLFHVFVLLSKAQFKRWLIFLVYGENTHIAPHMIQTISFLTIHFLYLHLPIKEVLFNQMKKTPNSEHDQRHQTAQLTFCFTGRIRVAPQSPMLKWIILLTFCTIHIFLLTTSPRPSMQPRKIITEINRRRSCLIPISRAFRKQTSR